MPNSPSYLIQDNFFTFWFRFIFKYAHILEIGNYEQLRDLIKRDYPTFSGLTLERYFRAKAIEEKRYTIIGRWWDRKGENEIDMIAANELTKTIDIFEIKRNRKNISYSALEAKVAKILSSLNLFDGYTVSIKGLDLTNM